MHKTAININDILNGHSNMSDSVTQNEKNKFKVVQLKRT